MRTISKKPTQNRAGRVAQVINRLPTKLEDLRLSSNSSIAKKSCWKSIYICDYKCTAKVENCQPKGKISSYKKYIYIYIFIMYEMRLF
jgi:hypothetical protein